MSYIKYINSIYEYHIIFFQPISKNVLINLVKNHPDISMLKVYSEQDLIDKVERFLDVNQTEVGLKNIPQCELNILHSGIYNLEINILGL